MTEQEIIDRVRFLLGDIPSSVLPDATLSYIITTCDKPTDCEKVYCVSLESLLYLYKKSLTDQAYQVGNVIRQKEEEGDVEIDIEYSTTVQSVGVQSWKQLYDLYVEHPEWVCEELLETSQKNGTWMYIGGVSKKKVDEVNDNSDSNGPRVGIGWLSDLGGRF